MLNKIKSMSTRQRNTIFLGIIYVLISIIMIFMFRHEGGIQLWFAISIFVYAVFIIPGVSCGEKGLYLTFFHKSPTFYISDIFLYAIINGALYTALSFSFSASLLGDNKVCMIVIFLFSIAINILSRSYQLPNDFNYLITVTIVIIMKPLKISLESFYEVFNGVIVNLLAPKDITSLSVEAIKNHIILGLLAYMFINTCLVNILRYYYNYDPKAN